MNATDKLLPCPFCGGKADYCETSAWWVRCNECNAETEAEMSPEAAAEIWNRRTSPPSSHVLPRPTFPILNGNGVRIDYQLVADHGGQAQRNHYQSVERLAQRGGLSWCELHAVLHDRAYQKMDQNTAIIECRALEARYLAALIAPSPQPREVGHD